MGIQLDIATTDGQVLNSDQVSGIDTQVIKIGVGAAGVAPTLVSNAAPLPVAIISGAGSGGTALADAATFTRGTTSETPAAGVVESASPSLTAGKASVLSLTTAGALRVDGSAVTQPVSGTFWQTTQPVSVSSLPLPTGAATAANQPGIGTAGTANANVLTIQGITGMTPVTTTVSGNVAVTGTFWQATQPVSGTFWQTTQPVSAASWPLPTGAATAANQPGIGTAGTSNANVLTVQGIAGMTALKVDGSGVTQPISGSVTANIGTTNGLALDTSVNGLLLAQGSTTSGQKGTLTMASVVTGTPTYTNAQTSPITVDGSGGLRVSIIAGAGSGGTALSDGSTFTRGTTSETPVGGIAETSAPSLTTGKAAALSINLSGGLRVDGSGVTQPVSGTFWQTTQPVSAASLPLPTGAATAANQPGIGTAGTANANVLTIQGIAGMTAVAVSGTFYQATQPVSGTFWQTTQPVSAASLPLPSGAATGVAQGSATSGEVGTLMQGAVTTSSPTYTNAQTSPLTLTTAGALRVDASATTQPVSGTFYPATQPVSGTFWQTTQPVSAASLPLPTGAATGVAQGSTTSSNVGTLMLGAVTTAAPSYTTAQSSPLSLDAAGNLRVNVVTGGATGGTSLADASTFTRGTTSETPVGGVAETSSPSLTTGKAAALSLTLAGALRVDASATTQPVSGTFWQTTQPISAASLPLPTGAATSANQPGIGTAGTSNANVLTVQGIASMTPFNVVGQIANQGAVGSTKPILVGAVYNSSGNTLTSGELGQMQLDSASNLLVNINAGGVQAQQDNTAFTIGTSQGLGVMGTFNDSATAIGSGDAGGIRSTADRQLQVAPGAAPSGGWTPYTYLAPATPAAQLVKGSYGQLGAGQCTNSSNTWAWLKIFNVASTGAVSLGTTTATQSIGIPPGGGFTFNTPKFFSTGIVIAVTGGASLTDDTAVGTASTVSINLDYK